MAKDAIMTALNETESKGEELQVNNSIADAIVRKVTEIAAKEGKATSAMLLTIAAAKEQTELGPVRLGFALLKDYGDDMPNWPDPEEILGNNPAKVKRSIQAAGSRKSKTETIDFYVMLADNWKEGADVVSEIDWLKRVADKDKSRDGIPEDFIAKYAGGHNDRNRSKRLSYLEGRRTTFRNAIKKAVSLQFQFQKIRGLEHVGVELEMEGDDVANTQRPFYIYAKSDDPTKPPPAWDHYSVGQFLRLDPAKAFENGGTFTALENTLARGNATNGDTGGTSADKPQDIGTTETFFARLTDLHEYMSRAWQEPSRTMYGHILKEINTSDEAIVSVFQIRDMLNDICEMKHLKEKFAKAEQALEDAA